MRFLRDPPAPSIVDLSFYIAWISPMFISTKSKKLCRTVWKIDAI